ncbi:hypothetical protein BDW69DRAFT_157090 [Aspergillus filifer]
MLSLSPCRKANSSPLSLFHILPVSFSSCLLSLFWLGFGPFRLVLAFMMVHLSRFLGFIARKLDRRQVEIESIVPGDCIEECGQAQGITDRDLQYRNGTDVCAPDSELSLKFSTCDTCCQEFRETHNITQEFIVPNYDRYLSLCPPDDPDYSTSLLLASLSSVDASRTALQTSLADLGYGSSTSPTPVSSSNSTTTPTESAGLSATNPDPSSEPTATNSRNLGVIIPAVVIPVVLIPLISLIAACLVMRRRRRRRLEYEQRAAGPSPFEGKVQFHGALKPELDAGNTLKSPSSPSPRDSEIVELPAREPVAIEMDASVIASAR